MKKLILIAFVATLFGACTSSNFRMPLSLLEKHDEKQANLTEKHFRQIEQFQAQERAKKK